MEATTTVKLNTYGNYCNKYQEPSCPMLFITSFGKGYCFLYKQKLNMWGNSVFERCVECKEKNDKH